MEGFCRGCLLQCSDPADLLPYTERNRRLFIYSTGLQVKRNDTFTFQLCKQCYYSMRQSCKFKKQCRTSDMKFRNFLMLKEDGDDFGSFIRNIDAHLSSRLPLTSGHSTPVYKKEKDDDNESTCTSIRNFMTEILEGEEMAPTEARIIREVIEEEADILDDSLDSHWLEDERSIASDMDIDFGSSPFITSHSEQNDHCYTPYRIKEEKQPELNFLTSKKIIDQIDKPSIPQKYDMPLLEDLNSNMDFGYKENKMDDSNAEKSPIGFNNSIPSEVEDMVTENSISSTLQCFKTDLLVDLAVKKGMDILDNDSNLFNDTYKDINNIITPNENELGLVLKQGMASKNITSPNELDYYVNKAEFKKQLLSTKSTVKEYHCTIDRNLDIALKNEKNVRLSLDQIIQSPAVSGGSEESTPTIKNILFGEKDQRTIEIAASTPMIENILFGDKPELPKAPKYFPQVGQHVGDDNSDSEDLDKINKNLYLDIARQKKDNHEDENNLNEILEKCLQTPSVPPGIEDNLNKEKIKIKEMDIHNEHMDVIDEFLLGANDASEICPDIIDQILDPDEIKDQDIFKRPMTPPYDKYDIDKCYCKICNRTFTSQKALKIHFAKIHKYNLPSKDPHRNKSQNNKIIICAICGKGIKCASHYARHKRDHEMKDKIMCQCDYCKQFFNSRLALQVHITKMHMKIKAKHKKHVCPICGKVSNTSTHDKIHQRRHLKEFSVFCEICNKGFYERAALKVHMRTHNNDYPYICDYCPMKFRARESLYQHVKRHLGHCQYKCNVCKIEYVCKSYLTKHYASTTCIKNRERASRKQKPNENVTVTFGKGSLDTIKKLMQVNKVKDLESDEVDLKSIEMKELIESKEEFESNNEVIDTEIVATEERTESKEIRINDTEM